MIADKRPEKSIDLSDASVRKIYEDVVMRFHSGIFVELGCLCGASTIYLAQQIKKHKRSITLYAVDLWQNGGNIFPLFWQNVVDAECDDIIYPIQADSAKAATLFKNRSIEFVYIDADHNYVPVTDDITSWLPKLNDRAWMGGHDYSYQVQRSVERIFGRDRGKRILDNSWLIQFEMP